ncbi:hypothetical protein ACFL2L_01475 [Patescibacteria group bacterium]
MSRQNTQMGAIKLNTKTNGSTSRSDSPAVISPAAMGVSTMKMIKLTIAFILKEVSSFCSFIILTMYCLLFKGFIELVMNNV